MTTILVVDDMPIVRVPIAATLQAAGYRTLCAASGPEALGLLRSERPDLILLDIGMPEMDGLTLLRLIRRSPNGATIPVILLTAEEDRTVVLKAVKLGAQGYILKSTFSLKDLLARVQKQLAPGEAVPKDDAPVQRQPQEAHSIGSSAVNIPEPMAIGAAENRAAAVPRPPTRAAQAASATPMISADIPQLLNRNQSIRRAEAALQGRTLSGVVAQVAGLAGSAGADVASLAPLIIRDSMLSARILKAANSPAYRTSRVPISTVPDAVRQIGCATVRNITASLGVFDAMPPSTPDGFNPIRCWQHSFAVALLCEKLGAQTAAGPGTAYMAGLCHDLGEIIFHTQFGEEYRQILEVEARTGKRRSDLERAMLGITHGELVETILRCLALPEAIRKPIAGFHTLVGRSSGSDGSLAAVLKLADLYANGMLLSSSDASPVESVTRAECRAVCGKDDPPSPDPEQFRSEIACLTSMLARLSSEEDSKLLAPLYMRREAKIWVARDPALSAFDPITVALQSLAEVELSTKLPNETEQNGVGGLVILSAGTSMPGFSAEEIRSTLSLAEGLQLKTLWVSRAVEQHRRDGAVEPNTVGPITGPLTLARLAQFVVDSQGIPVESDD
jgi:CheY-like chemotaxis protein/HD-like signal output (HDOD) protein